MKTLIYDESFAGWLTAVFELYEFKWPQVTITPACRPEVTMFSEARIIITDEAKALRVWAGLKKRLSQQALEDLYRSFLSEYPGMEDRLLQYVQYVFRSPQNIESDYSHPSVQFVGNIAKKVGREKHRMEAFVRLQQLSTADAAASPGLHAASSSASLYYASISPDFNVLPLIRQHFEQRYADQQWIIYDLRRKYGIFYNLDRTDIITIDFNEGVDTGRHITTVTDPCEVFCQQLWQTYFDRVNIGARKNTKLHIQHMPRRYWKFLTEKQPR